MEVVDSGLEIVDYKLVEGGLVAQGKRELDVAVVVAVVVVVEVEEAKKM